MDDRDEDESTSTVVVILAAHLARVQQVGHDVHEPVSATQRKVLVIVRHMQSVNV